MDTMSQDLRQAHRKVRQVARAIRQRPDDATKAMEQRAYQRAVFLAPLRQAVRPAAVNR